MDKSIIVLGFRFEIEFGQSIMDERITQSQHIRNIRIPAQKNKVMNDSIDMISIL